MTKGVTNEMPPGHVVATDAAHLLGQGYLATRDLLFKGKLSGVRVGRNWAIDVRSIHAYLASCEADRASA